MHDLDQRLVAIVKGLILDATRQANSGHPGGALSSTDFVTLLYKEFLRFNPDDPAWFNRDRFILSCGHESALLYAVLHLAGWLETSDLKDFRQFGSLTPGHPEHDLTPGVEATTGPLGQGLAMAVGMAAAEAHLRALLGKDVCDHYTYVLASDGDMQEGVSYGASTLAGVWGLGKLIVYYNANKVQLAGPVCDVDCTDFRKIYEGICWHVIEVDGHDHEQIRAAVREAQAQTAKPTLIIGHGVMAKGTASREGDYTTHGSPLPPEEIAASKEKLGLPSDEFFHTEEEAVAAFRARYPELRELAAGWGETLTAKLEADTAFAEAWNLSRKPRSEYSLELPDFEPGQTIATRKAWGACLEALALQMPTLVGGSADLDPSNQTVKFKEACGPFCQSAPLGRSMHFGVREFPMAAILNGIALHGGLAPFGATFLAFSDYERGALRMSALQKLPVLHVFTHDSFHVGEDGPTHQPVEHVSSLRLIPDMLVLRPADANETAACIDLALTRDETPSCLILTRQGLPVLDASVAKPGAARGGYVLADAEGDKDVLLLAAGSEVSLALETAKLLDDLKVRVVSVPSMELFDAQPDAYKREVLCPARLKAAAEAGRPELWYKYVGCDGLVLGMSRFGASAPAGRLAREFGFTPENLAALIRERL